jgi:CBS domain-containing protein
LTARTVDRNDHAAAAAYLMKHAAATVLMVVDTQTDQPVGIITEADIAHAVADEKDVNRVRINNLMTRRRQEVCTRRGAGLYRRAQDPPHRRRAAAVTEPAQFAIDPAVPQAGTSRAIRGARSRMS